MVLRLHKAHALVGVIHTQKSRKRVPTWRLPSEHASQDARTLPQVGVRFSQLKRHKRFESTMFTR